MPSPSATSLDRLRAQAQALRERPGGASGGDVERALNDVYAEVIALEATRTRLRRRQLEHMADVLAPGEVAWAAPWRASSQAASAPTTASSRSPTSSG